MRGYIAMESPLVSNGLRRAIVTYRNSAKRAISQQSRRCLATSPDASGAQQQIRAAGPIRFAADRDQFARGTHGKRVAGGRNRGSEESRRRTEDQRNEKLLRSVRIVPASPSYFTATPRYIDDLLHLTTLLRRHLTLPVVDPGQAPRVAWKTYGQYKTEVAEPVRSKGYSILTSLLKRLNHIHPSLIPSEVTNTLSKYKRLVQPFDNVAKPIVVDEHGRARAVGRRKSSHAQVYLVEGDGQCLINGRTLAEYFGRLHDRESAMWALKATQRLDKYNIWAVVRGGGTTGQAEAITLGVTKALLAHEPDLKPILRIAGCVSRDPRRVERKKPGRLKARKMPTWVKR